MARSLEVQTNEEVGRDDRAEDRRHARRPDGPIVPGPGLIFLRPAFVPRVLELA
jgi:hypothetical protein